MTNDISIKDCELDWVTGKYLPEARCENCGHFSLPNAFRNIEQADAFLLLSPHSITMDWGIYCSGRPGYSDRGWCCKRWKVN